MLKKKGIVLVVTESLSDAFFYGLFVNSWGGIC